MPRECGGLSRCATPLRLVRKLPSLLGERIARADRAAWCRRSRRARDRTHFAVDTPELEDLAALAGAENLLRRLPAKFGCVSEGIVLQKLVT